MRLFHFQQYSSPFWEGANCVDNPKYCKEKKKNLTHSLSAHIKEWIIAGYLLNLPILYMKKVIVFPLLFALFGFGHPFYLSVTDLKFNAKENALQGYVKIFTNDLEDALRKKNGKAVDLINPKDSVMLKKILQSYLQEHLSISVNNKIWNYELMGFENEEGALWLYIQMKNCPFPSAITINNSILYDFLKDQSNIVHIEVHGEKKSLKVNYPETLLKFEFLPK